MEPLSFVFTVLLISKEISDTLSDAFSECSQSGQGIELSSSLDRHNRTAACPGETVVYSCTVANTGGLEWAVESFHSFGSNSIVLSVAYNPVGTVIQEEGGLITANVTAAVPYMVYWGEITSTLTLLAHKSFHNKTVWCSNGVLDQSKSPCILHKYGVPPSAPLFPIYTVIYHNIATFTMFVEWTRPQRDGGLGITNYTATLRAPFSQHTYHVDVSDKLYIALFYNKMYTLQISAANCGGIGPPANISNIYSVSCGLPDLLLANSSSLESISVSTHEGSQVTFACGYDEKVVLKCLSNGTWTPDPSEIQCSNIMPFLSDVTHCGVPVLPPHSHADRERSVPRSVLVYQCDSGYEPTEQVVSTCSSAGEWKPNITALECIKQVDCGNPLTPVGGYVHYTGTREGSKALIECGEGMKLEGDDVNTLAVCSANGSWFPDPSIHRCIHIFNTERDSLSPKQNENGVYLYVISGGAVLLVSLPLGMLLGCLCSKIFNFKKHRPTPSSQHCYEEVKLQNQPKIAMNMTENEAYALPIGT